ncbi:hypothetical protein BO94DRAFT_470492 [Aspergillus sclerotioniger CBS 115572]|uniref:F-box domain-containing protein n=1 Tax=Aspergillus sclerotioniger CBS 115572 TaxID=1450535 RepID=A0A317W450_9EURO|nr:hypothetical protein BO94DRAFT_470492 [Aspergillus sclerotioniger CBS 115572]PWY80785.1 hypothetical protein BO94DRAFT_470492 [Aspergillus sclerotioniger CBS 115572]
MQLQAKCPPSERCLILELPTEILVEIISHLSVLPEACLALTCKRLFSLCATSLSSTQLRFPGDLAPRFHHENNYNFLTPRWQFAKLLEGKRWQVCSRCLRLHPRASYTSKQLKRMAEDRCCGLGDLGGLVDVCPCKKMTFRDTIDLIELLKIRERSVGALGTQFGLHVQERFPWHSCYQSYGTTTLRIEISPELNDAHQLKITTSYKLSVESGQLGKNGHLTWRLGCAHRTIDLWLASVCQAGVLNLYHSACDLYRQIQTCSICETTLVFPRGHPLHVKSDPEKDLYVFRTERLLGGSAPVLSHAWTVQRIHPTQYQDDTRESGLFFSTSHSFTLGSDNE